VLDDLPLCLTVYIETNLNLIMKWQQSFVFNYHLDYVFNDTTC